MEPEEKHPSVKEVIAAEPKPKTAAASDAVLKQFINNLKGLDSTPAEEAGVVSPPADPKVDVPLMKHNQIRVIYPWKEGAWVFDDDAVGLSREPFVQNFGAIIDDMVKGIKDAEDGFMMWFSGEPFDGAKETFTLANADGKENRCGNDYKYDKDGRVGWLCPALYKYFNVAPQKLYFKCEELKSKTHVVGRRMVGILEKYFNDPRLLHRMMREMASIAGKTVRQVTPVEVSIAQKEALPFGLLMTRYFLPTDQVFWKFSGIFDPKDASEMLKDVYTMAKKNNLIMHVQDAETPGKAEIILETLRYEPEEAWEVKEKIYYWQQGGRFEWD